MKLKYPGILLIIIGAYYFISSLKRYLEVTDSDRVRNSIIIMICGISLMSIRTFACRKAIKKVDFIRTINN